MHINQLVKYLENYGTLTSEDKQYLTNLVKIKEYKTGDMFLQSGKIAQEVGFIIEGVFRYFFYDNLGNEITSYFMSENQFVTNVTSFNEYSMSSGCIKAETNCNVLIIDRKSWDLCCKNITNWNSIIATVTSKTLLKKTNFQRQLINQDAKSTYLSFLKTNPSIIARVPQTHIASFLGITKFSLSRIRKQISKE
ncbi:MULTISPECIES: Crp/Fnr family transcriptional regulator [unclassified Algibacter]|jgi:CRP-like cAMP-binding protein|uniref:Crp/Fnr family transcriptional regulator n=1 Tax=unclassified Algibacter TaxID=2615009 RepID=UPI00131B3558|nr:MULTISPECIES: Crp/Fnr family transcriptional regulator [unclassified Algibacter]MCL5129553.1 Crp/Fnr family transcriptional regulator [Algibacter sp. L4_22]